MEKHNKPKEEQFEDAPKVELATSGFRGMDK